MEVFRDTARFTPTRHPVLIALGTFDGVHLGHRHVIGHLRQHAAATGGWSVVATFDPHPLAIIAPPPEPFLLTTLEERLALLAALEVDAVLVFSFTEAFRQITADDFITDVLIRQLQAHHVFVGPNHTFGRDRGGSVELLARRGSEVGLAVHVVPGLRIEGARVSSTHIRRLLVGGDVAAASRFLGRRYTLRGEVAGGERRGVRLGFPTANLQPPPEKVIPRRGVYAAVATVEDRRWQAVVNIGTRPTFGGQGTRVEAHLLDFSGDLYGASLELVFVARLRDEQAFGGPEALVRQIEQDIAAARGVLAAAGRAE